MSSLFLGAGHQIHLLHISIPFALAASLLLSSAQGAGYALESSTFHARVFSHMNLPSPNVLFKCLAEGGFRELLKLGLLNYATKTEKSPFPIGSHHYTVSGALLRHS